MKNICLYKNGSLNAIGAISEINDGENPITGRVELNQFIISVVGVNSEISKKILLIEDFIISLEEKLFLSEKFQEYIDAHLHNLRSKEIPTQDVSIEYKKKFYWYDLKAHYNSSEKTIVRAIGLYNNFNDPKNLNVMEVKFEDVN